MPSSGAAGSVAGKAKQAAEAAKNFKDKAKAVLTGDTKQRTKFNWTSVADGSLGDGVNGVTRLKVTDWKPYPGPLGKLTMDDVPLGRPTYDPSIEIVHNPQYSTFQRVMNHENRHALDATKHPQFTHFANTRYKEGTLHWWVPGRGLAKYMFESRGYFAEFGLRGLKPTTVLNSMPHHKARLAVDLALLAATLTYFAW